MENSPENRFESLAGEVEELKKRLDDLEASLSRFPSLLAAPGQVSRAAGPSSAAAAETGLTEDLWAWLGKASLLPRVAAISFALVLALLLRTLTDASVIAQQTGSYIGLGYAALLMVLGWQLLARKRSLAPILLTCGAVLMFLIILEAHARFAALSTLAAYALLLITMGGLVILALRHGSSFIATLGLLGAGITGFGIDFPNPAFPLLAFFLLITTSISYLVSNRPSHRETARWGFVLLAVLFWINWMIKLDPSAHGAFRFLAFLLLFHLLYSLMIVHRAFVLGRISVLDSLLPTLAGPLFYLAARAVLVPSLDHPALVGIAGLAWSALLFVAAFLAVHRRQSSPLAACVFTFAGAVLLLLTIPDITASILLSLPVWSVGALFLVKLSSHCEVGGIRLASYLLQVTACAAAIMTGSFATQTSHFPLSVLIAGMLTVLSGYHYLTSRRYPLNCSTGFFARIDPGDKTAMVLLLATVVNGYAALQLGAAFSLAGMALDLDSTLQGLRSVFLNGGALLLMVLGLRSQNREMLAVALVVFLGGAGKVFGYDLFVLTGVPLMMGVFSFGLAAALGSVVLSRWQKNA